jgi:hypothetical protein
LNVIAPMLRCGAWATLVVLCLSCSQEAHQSRPMCEPWLTSAEEVDCITPSVECVSIQQRGVTTHPPAGVRVLFSVTDCNGDPIRELRGDEVTIVNDDRGAEFGANGEGGGISLPSTPVDYGLFSVLALDMSGSIFSNQDRKDAVFDAAEAFVRAAVSTPPAALRQKVAIQVFGRQSATRIVIPFTDDPSALLAKINELRNTQEPLGSTDLYGAYLAAVEEVMSQGAGLELVERSVVIFSDGVHEAGDEAELRRRALQAKQNRFTSFSVYLGESNDAESISVLSELASREENFDVAAASDNSNLSTTFERIARKIYALARSNYVIGICTPVYRGDNASLTVKLDIDGVKGEWSAVYPTSGLNGDTSPDACSPEDVVGTCAGQGCQPQTQMPPGTSLPADTPMDGDTPGGGASSEMMCLPGSRLGICSACDANGQQIVPAMDEACGSYNCGGGYEKVIEGDDEVCYSSGIGVAGCSGLGQCQTEQEFCSNVQRREVLRVPVDPCRRMAGCSGTTPGFIHLRLALDEMCNLLGVCQPRADNLLAECSVQIPARCNYAQATDARLYCGAGVSGGQDWCEYFVSPSDGSSRRCVDFCEGLGMEICDQTQEECCWNNATESTCDKSGTVSCGVDPCGNADGCGDQICRCFIPR